MSGHELALQKALIAHLSEDVAVQALLGDPARIRDAAPREGELPHLLIGRCESRPVGADGGGVEHRLTLTVVSRFRGTEEAKAVLAAVRLRLADARIQRNRPRPQPRDRREHPRCPLDLQQYVLAALCTHGSTSSVTARTRSTA